MKNDIEIVRGTSNTCTVGLKKLIRMRDKTDTLNPHLYNKKSYPIYKIR